MALTPASNWERWKSAFPVATGTMNDTHVSGNTVIFEVTWRGTHNGPLPMPNGGELAATGLPVEIRAVLVTVVEDGKIASQRHYLDMLAMLTQLGVIPYNERIVVFGRREKETTPGE